MQTHEDLSRAKDVAGGLISNPFIPSEVYRAGTTAVRLAEQAAVMRLLKVIELAAADTERKPILVEKSPAIPAYYPVASLAGMFAAAHSGIPVPGIVQVYIPIDMMKLGRVRAALGLIAERVAGGGVDLTLAAWSRIALTQPDTDCAEWVVLGGADIAALVAEIDANPSAFSAKVFGELVNAREGAEDTEMLMRISSARQGRLETDPLEVDADDSVGDSVADEQALDDPMAEAFVTPLADGSDTIVEDAEPEGPSQEELVFDYIVAYTRLHLSPVVARGIRAYKAQGVYSMTQEFRITKAPTKTLSALLKFAETRERIGVLIFDGFSMWSSVPDELRMKIIATLQRLRWALKDEAVLVLLVEPGQAPEVDEAFAAATRISWDFHELAAVESRDAIFDAVIAREWALSSSTDDRVPEWLDALIGAVPADVTFEAALPVLGTLVSEWMTDGIEPSPADVILGLESTGEVAPE